MNRMIKEFQRFLMPVAILPGVLLSFPYSSFAYNGKKRIIEAEAANSVVASKVADVAASGKYLVSLSKSGEAISFVNLSSANKLAIRYASVKTGTVSVVVNNQSALKVNIHSSGALTGSFLYAII